MLPRFFKQSLPSEPRQVVPSEHDHAAPDPEPAALAPPYATSLPAGSLQLAHDSMIADGTAGSITADPVMAPGGDTLVGAATQGVSTAHDESHSVDESRPDAPRLVSPRRGTVPRKRARRGETLTRQDERAGNRSRYGDTPDTANDQARSSSPAPCWPRSAAMSVVATHAERIDRRYIVTIAHATLRQCSHRVVVTIDGIHQVAHAAL